MTPDLPIRTVLLGNPADPTKQPSATELTTWGEWVEEYLDGIGDDGVSTVGTPEAYGAVGDGVADDTVALKAFFAALPGKAGRLLPGKTYRVATGSELPFLVSGGNFSLDMRGATIDASGIGQVSTIRSLIRVTGSIGSSVSLSSSVQAGRISFLTSTSHALAKGDTVLMSSDDLQGPEYNALETRGQFATVAAVLSATAFMTDESIYNALSTNPVMRKVTFARDIDIRGGRLIGPGRHATHNGDIAIDLQYTQGAKVRGVRIERFDFQAISVDQSRDYEIAGNMMVFDPRWVTRFINTAAAGSASTLTLAAGSPEAEAVTGTYVGWTVEIVSGTGQGQQRAVIAFAGSTDVLTVRDFWEVAPNNTSVYALFNEQLDQIQYGVAIKNASDGGRVIYNTVYGSKHGVDFTRNSNPGISRLTDIESNIVYGSWDAAIATHGKSTHAKIHKNWSISCLYGIASRTPDNEICYNHAIRCNEAVRLTDNPSRNLIHDNVDEDCIFGIRLPSTDMSIGGPDRIAALEITGNKSYRARQNAIEIAPSLITRDGYATGGSTTTVVIQAPGSAFDAAAVFVGGTLTVTDVSGSVTETRTITGWNYGTLTVTVGVAFSFTVVLGDEYTLTVSAFTGTMASATSTTAVITNPGIDPNADGVDAADDYLIGMFIETTGGTGSGQLREITDWVQATNTVTVAAWSVTPNNTTTYRIFDQHEGLRIGGNTSEDCAGPDIEVWGRWTDVKIHDNKIRSREAVATAGIFVNGTSVQYPTRVDISGNTIYGKLDPLVTDFARGFMVDGQTLTRAQLVLMLAAGHVFTAGVTYWAGGYPYLFDGVSTGLDGLPGFTAPQGTRKLPEHFAAQGFTVLGSAPDASDYLNDWLDSGGLLRAPKNHIYKVTKQIVIPTGAQIDGQLRLAFVPPSGQEATAIDVLSGGDDLSIEDVYLETVGATNARMLFGSGYRGGRIRMIADAESNNSTVKFGPDIGLDDVDLENICRGVVVEAGSLSYGGRIGSIRVKKFIRGFRPILLDDLRVGRVDAEDRATAASKTAGHNGILVTDCENLTIDYVRINGAGEHAVRIAGATNAARIGIGSLEAHNTGGSILKINADVIARDIHVGAVFGSGNHATGPGGNSEGLRLSHVDGFSIGSVHLSLAPGATFVAQDGITLNDARNGSIGPCYFAACSARFVRASEEYDIGDGLDAGPVGNIRIESMSGHANGAYAFAIDMPTENFGPFHILGGAMSIENDLLNVNDIAGGVTGPVFMAGDVTKDGTFPVIDDLPDDGTFILNFRVNGMETVSTRGASNFSAPFSVQGAMFDPADVGRPRGTLNLLSPADNADAQISFSALVGTWSTGTTLVGATSGATAEILGIHMHPTVPATRGVLRLGAISGGPFDKGEALSSITATAVAASDSDVPFGAALAFSRAGSGRRGAALAMAQTGPDNFDTGLRVFVGAGTTATNEVIGAWEFDHDRELNSLRPGKGVKLITPDGSADRKIGLNNFGDLTVGGSAMAYRSQTPVVYANRAALVSLLASPPSWLVAGMILKAADTGVEWRYTGSGTLISDMPGTVPPTNEWALQHWGATGTGTGNDGPAINLAFAAFKTAIEAMSPRVSALTLTGLGASFRTTISINATGITGWGWCIKDMTLIGACTGKAVMDMIGTRGGFIEQFHGIGEQANMPSVGIQMARSGTGEDAFASSGIMDHCHWQGWFSTATFHGYGYEGWVFRSCNFWKSNPDARAIIGVGYNAVAMASDYLTPITGTTSFILNMYQDCEFRDLPEGRVATITNISQAANAVVTTSSAHPFINGQTITLSQLEGVAATFSSRQGVCTVLSATTFSLAGVNTTGMASAYTGGGLAARASTVAPMLFGRGSQHTFSGCYIVAYGTPAIDHTFSATTSSLDDQNDFDFLFEGAPTHLMRFIDVDADKQLRGFRFKTYNGMPDVSVFTTTATAPRVLRIRNAKIEVNNWAYRAVPLFSSSATTTGLLFAEVYMPNLADFDATAGAQVLSFIGQQSAPDAGTVRFRSSRLEAPFLNNPAIADAGTQRWQVLSGGTIAPMSNLASNLGAVAIRVGQLSAGTINLGSTDVDGRIVTTGNGTPEGNVTALVGSLYINRTGTPGTLIYLKETGTGNTGWVAKW